MSAEPYLSICIPAYGMGGQGARYLRHSLDVLAQQSFTDFEVVVADQSEDEAVAGVCADHPGMVRHVWTRDVPRQGSANTNAAMRAARGEVLKILFQDDFLIDRDALRRIADVFRQGASWCLTGSDHTQDGATLIQPFHPRYHAQVQFGRNTVSSPSVLALRRENAPSFDENLVWLMDVDFYKQCELRFGPPTILSQPTVVNRLHDGQVSAGISKALVRRELRYVRDKYRDQMTAADWWHYAGRMWRALV